MVPVSGGVDPGGTDVADVDRIRPYASVPDMGCLAEWRASEAALVEGLAVPVFLADEEKGTMYIIVSWVESFDDLLGRWPLFPWTLSTY